MIQIETIQQHVAASFGIPIIEMTSDRVERNAARPRQIAMYLARYLTTRSLPRIGRSFGNRDRTTVQFAVKRIEALIGSDELLAYKVAIIRKELEAEPEHV